MESRYNGLCVNHWIPEETMNLKENEGIDCGICNSKRYKKHYQPKLSKESVRMLKEMNDIL